MPCKCPASALVRQNWRLEEGSDCLAGQAEICCHERLSRNIALTIVMSLRATATIPPLQSSCACARESACRISRGDRSRITGRHNASAHGMLRIDGYRLVSGMRLNALDWLNFFLADVRGGLGAYVNVFLLK